MTEKKHLQNKPQVRIQSSRFFLMEDEPMRMRVKQGKWYADFFHNGNFIGLSLKAYKPEKKKALINLGKILEKLANGETIGSINKKLKDIVKKPEQVFIKKTGETDHQFVGLWKNHVSRLLGKYKVCDLTPEIMAQYMEDHWGLNEDEELQVMFSSFNKERHGIKGMTYPELKTEYSLTYHRKITQHHTAFITLEYEKIKNFGFVQNNISVSKLIWLGYSFSIN